MRVDDNLQNSVWFWPYVINVRFWKPGLKPGIIDDTHFVDGLDVREASGVLCLVLVVVILIVRWWQLHFQLEHWVQGLDGCSKNALLFYPFSITISI